LVGLEGQKGDRVILASDSSFYWVVAYLGILWSGRVCVPLPAGISSQELRYILDDTSSRHAFLQGAVLLKQAPLLRNVHVITSDQVESVPGLASQRALASICQGEGGSPVLCETEMEDLAALMFTSGSTGRPRGVMVSHANIVANTESILEYLELTERDRILAVLPFHYCFGTSLLHTHLRVGGSVVVESRFLYPESVLQRMLDTECTGFAGVPSHFQILLRTSSIRKKQFPRLRYVQQAGGYLAPSFVRELREALPGAKIYIMYGQTEATARLSYLPPEVLETKAGSIGRGIPGVRLQVLSELGEEVKPGEVGEIVAEGANVSRGYWRAPDETARAFRGGKLYTGDLATVDSDGYIYIVDRMKDFLKCGGQRVSCRLLEEQLLECDDLLEAAVVGIPDDVLGEAVRAFVVPREAGVSGLRERLLLSCKKRMPPQLVPKDVVVLASLPKNGAGKVLKQSLRML
jgi:acyl-CoA synthetase (AMP-forming)/AMP-acid ligase II